MSTEEQRAKWRAEKAAKRQDPQFRARERAHIYAWRAGHKDRVSKINKRWIKKHGRQYYKDHCQQKRAASRRTYAIEMLTNPEQRKRRKHRYWEKNKVRLRKAAKLKRLANLEHYRMLDRRRYQRDQEKRIHQSRVARAKRGGQECYLTLAEWKQLLHRFRYRCFYCGIQLNAENRSLDHKVPLVRGGTNDISNLVPCCLPCNQRKHTMTDVEFKRSLTIQ